MSLAFQVAIAFVIDLLLGDPRGYPHPVKIIACFASALESFFRKTVSNLKLAGLFTTVMVVGTTFAAVWLFVHGLNLIHPALGLSASIIFIYTTLSIRSLFDESRPVYKYLKDLDIVKARKSLSNIVGRDTAHLEKTEIVRATVETVAESTVDGIIAPLFFAILGGAPLAMAFKAINTMDSLFGYKNDLYLDFGWASARLDDIANWLPARLAIPLMAVSATLCGLSGKNSLRIAIRDGDKHPSPNSGIPEAAMAGALGVRLGGTSKYSGITNVKPFIGDPIRELELPDIHQSHKLMFTTSLIMVGVAIASEVIWPFL